MSDNSEQIINENFTFETKRIIRIPIKRIGAVIGKGGNNRREIEAATHSKISIDSDTGEVEIRPDKELKDPVLLLKAEDIVKAIGRGFFYKEALKLVKDEYQLEVILLKQNVGKNPNQLRRVKSRIIGTDGKTRKQLEDLTKTSIVISGSTVSVIGEFEQNLVAIDALERIITGSPIESVLKFLEERKKNMKKEDKPLWKTGDETPTMAEAFEESSKEVPDEDIFEDFED